MPNTKVISASRDSFNILYQRRQVDEDDKKRLKVAGYHHATKQLFRYILLSVYRYIM